MTLKIKENTIYHKNNEREKNEEKRQERVCDRRSMREMRENMQDCLFEDEGVCPLT